MFFEGLSKNTAHPDAEKNLRVQRELNQSFQAECILSLQRESYGHLRLTSQETIKNIPVGLSKEIIEFLTLGRLGTKLRNGKHIMNIFFSRWYSLPR